jgi:hypothetical protein
MPKHVRPNLMLKVNPVAKLKALSFHESQLDGGNPYSGVAVRAAKEIASREYFRIYKR